MAEPQYRWVIVAAGAVMGCVALGAMCSLPVLLRPMTTATGWSTTGVSAAMTIGFLAMASTAQSLQVFQLAFGLLVGFATSAMFASVMACVTGWFTTQRSLAVSLVSAGFGVGAAHAVAAGGMAGDLPRLAPGDAVDRDACAGSHRAGLTADAPSADARATCGAGARRGCP